MIQRTLSAGQVHEILIRAVSMVEDLSGKVSGTVYVLMDDQGEILGYRIEVQPISGVN